MSPHSLRWRALQRQCGTIHLPMCHSCYMQSLLWPSLSAGRWSTVDPTLTGHLGKGHNKRHHSLMLHFLYMRIGWCCLFKKSNNLHIHRFLSLLTPVLPFITSLEHRPWSLLSLSLPGGCCFSLTPDFAPAGMCPWWSAPQNKWSVLRWIA